MPAKSYAFCKIHPAADCLTAYLSVILYWVSVLAICSLSEPGLQLHLLQMTHTILCSFNISTGRNITNITDILVKEVYTSERKIKCGIIHVKSKIAIQGSYRSPRKSYRQVLEQMLRASFYHLLNLSIGCSCAVNSLKHLVLKIGLFMVRASTWVPSTKMALLSVICIRPCM